MRSENEKWEVLIRRVVELGFVIVLLNFKVKKLFVNV